MIVVLFTSSDDGKVRFVQFGAGLFDKLADAFFMFTFDRSYCF